MGRPSKLTDAQWEAIRKRLLAGEVGRELAREFGVVESAIRKRFGAQIKQIKDVANQIVATEVALKALPVSAQISAHDYAAQLRAITTHTVGAAQYGAAISHRLMGIAHDKVMEIDDASPLGDESAQTLKGIAVLTRMANESSEIGLNLLRANKDAGGNPLREIDVTPENGLTPEEEYLKFIG